MCKRQNVLQEDWKYLFIFDACRYDHFAQNYSLFFNGELEKQKSPATYTAEWLHKSFTNYYDDIIYISSIFFCNSLKPINRYNTYFFGKEHFFEVVDAWRTCWSPEYMTVPPWSMAQITRRKAMQYPNKRLIVHFFQPHAPYLSIPLHKNQKEEMKKREERLERKAKKTKYPDVKKILRKSVTTPFHRFFGTERLWEMIQLFGLDPVTSQEQVWRKVGSEQLIDAYIKNLCAVMQVSKMLTDHLPPGKISITADHGELLGEKKFWGHGPPKPKLPELVMVPWFEVERTKGGIE